MAYFPMYVDMNHLKVLVVGAGHVATEKLEKLTDFTENITIIATKVKDEAQMIIDKHHLVLHQKEYKIGDVQGFDIVIVATTEALQKSIYEETRVHRILVNSVDNKAYCDFIFPSYIQRDDLSIAFSTGGASPAFAKRLCQHVESILPETIGEFLKKMKSLRTILPKGKERMVYFEKEVEDYFLQYFK